MSCEGCRAVGAEERGVWPAESSPRAFTITPAERMAAALRVSDWCLCSYRDSAKNIFATLAGGNKFADTPALPFSETWTGWKVGQRGT